MTGTRNKRDYLYSVLIKESDVSNQNLYVNQRVGCIRPIGIVPRFLAMLLKHNVLLDIIFSSSTGSANQANIGISALQTWIIPIPPLDEQQIIFAQVEKLMCQLDESKKRIYERKQLSEMLMQSVLREAFEK